MARNVRYNRGLGHCQPRSHGVFDNVGQTAGADLLRDLPTVCIYGLGVQIQQ
jgi:hypothetical protein